MKWKERLQESIMETQREIDQQFQLQQEAEFMFDVLQMFRGSSVSSVLSLLYEGPHAIKSTVFVERRKKVG